MTEKRFKRFHIADGFKIVAIKDNDKIMNSKQVCNKLNELHEENEQLKSDNFNLNKTVECLNETVKEQCNKIDWADECGVRWEEEYEKWKG